MNATITHGKGTHPQPSTANPSTLSTESHPTPTTTSTTPDRIAPALAIERDAAQAHAAPLRPLGDREYRTVRCVPQTPNPGGRRLEAPGTRPLAHAKLRLVRAGTSVLRVNTTLAAIALSVAAMLASPAAASADSLQYVALGDSYASVGNLLHPVPGSSLLCAQDQESYPQVTAKALGLSLTDMACSDADTADLSTSQFPGVPPQFDGLSPSTKIVSIEIGGNDNQLLINLIAECTAADVADVVNVGAPCKTLFGNHFADEIAADAPTIARAYQTIHALSPHAKVFAVGTPDVLPQHGNCYPWVPLTTADVTYANGIELDLNRMIQTQARANGVTYVNTYTPTIGHDACQPEANRWIEPLIAGGPYLFLHPNVNGEGEMANLLEHAITAATTPAASHSSPRRRRHHRHDPGRHRRH